MKKHAALMTGLVLLSFSAASIVATYPGKMEKQGPEAEFLIGYASDSKAQIELETTEKEGLNITFPKNYSFNPEKEQRNIQRADQNLPLKEFQIKVKSENPVRKVYKLPFTLAAYSNSNQEGRTTPRIVQERDYEFTYHTEASNSFEGDLLNSNPVQNNESEVERAEDQPVQEQDLRNQSQQDTEQNQEKTNEEGSSTTLILALSVVLIFGYTIYEAIT